MHFLVQIYRLAVKSRNAMLNEFLKEPIYSIYKKYNRKEGNTMFFTILLLDELI